MQNDVITDKHWSWIFFERTLGSQPRVDRFTPSTPISSNTFVEAVARLASCMSFQVNFCKL